MSYRSTHSSAGRSKRSARRGFTLLEALVAMLLMAIVLPSIGQGISIATRMATEARYRNEASGLAEAKLAQILADGTWLNGTTAGDFAPDWPQYTWQAAITPWTQDTSEKSVQQIDLKVSWMDGNRPRSLTISTLAYDRSQTQ